VSPNRSPRPWQLMLPLALGLALFTLLAAPGPSYAATGNLFDAALTAAAEVPTPGPTGATGSARLTSYIGRIEVCFEINVEGLDAGDMVTSADIRLGAAGVAGDVVMPLFTEPPSGDISGCVQDFDAGLQDQLFFNPAGYYINVHTESYPDGAVRGQLQAVAGVPAACGVAVTPTTVAVGEQFVVSGTFLGGNPEVYLVRGVDAAFPQGAEPDAVGPADDGFSVAFTAKAGDEGSWTVWAVLPGIRCGGAVALTITPASIPDGALPAPSQLPVGAIGAALVVAALLALYRRRIVAR
jgi:hypothetical protein